MKRTTNPAWATAPLILFGSLEYWLVTRSVPDVEDLDLTQLLRDLIKDAIPPKDDLAQRTMRTSWIGRSDERKRAENPHVTENALADPSCRSRIVLGDV